MLRRHEFWAADLDEIYWLLDSRKPQAMFGKLTEEEAEECYQEALTAKALARLEAASQDPEHN